MESTESTSAHRPHITLVTLGSPAALAVTAGSLVAQGLDAWDWVVSGAHESLPQDVETRTRFVEEWAGASAVGLDDNDDRVMVLLPGGVALAPGTLERLALEFEGTDVDLLYGDDLVVTADGSETRRTRPEWSPERLRHHEYTGALVAVRSEVVRRVGGLRPELGDAAQHDLVLRVGEIARTVRHVPEVLGHVGATAPTATSAERVRAVQEHLERTGIDARAEASPAPGVVATHRLPDLTTPVSVIIPTIGTREEIRGAQRTMVTETIRSVARRTAHRAVEYVVVYDPPTPPSVLDELRALESETGQPIRLVEFAEPFNFSAKCNVGAAHCDGDVLVFLNDDMEAITDGPLESLIAPLAEPGVGATGPKLRFEDGRIQSAGIQYGSGWIRNRYRLSAADELGEANELVVSREVTALTGACLAMRRSVYETVGGFSETFPMNYNDVDLGLKLLRHGLRLLWLSDVELYHFESVTRDRTVHPWELERISRRWGDRRQVRERYASAL